MPKQRPNPTFAALLKQLRERAELSVAALAEKAQLNRETVRLYEAGQRQPTWRAVQQLATALGVSTESLRDLS